MWSGAHLPEHAAWSPAACTAPGRWAGAMGTIARMRIPVVLHITAMHFGRVGGLEEPVGGFVHLRWPETKAKAPEWLRFMGSTWYKCGRLLDAANVDAMHGHPPGGRSPDLLEP